MPVSLPRHPTNSLAVVRQHTPNQGLLSTSAHPDQPLSIITFACGFAAVRYTKDKVVP